MASIGSGTAYSSRPMAMAAAAVSSAPERSGASTTTTASARPAMMRLRRAKSGRPMDAPDGDLAHQRASRTEQVAGQRPMARRIDAVDRAKAARRCRRLLRRPTRGVRRRRCRAPARKRRRRRLATAPRRSRSRPTSRSRKRVGSRRSRRRAGGRPWRGRSRRASAAADPGCSSAGGYASSRPVTTRPPARSVARSSERAMARGSRSRSRFEPRRCLVRRRRRDRELRRDPPARRPRRTHGAPASRANPAGPMPGTDRQGDPAVALARAPAGRPLRRAAALGPAPTPIMPAPPLADARAPRPGARARTRVEPARSAMVRATRAARCSRRIDRPDLAGSRVEQRPERPARSRCARRSSRVTGRRSAVPWRSACMAAAVATRAATVASRLAAPRPSHGRRLARGPRSCRAGRASVPRGGPGSAVARRPRRRTSWPSIHEPPAWARIEGGEQHEPRGQREDALDAGDRHGAGVDRTAQRVERVSAELEGLVEEQRAAMRQARLARPDPGPAADERLRRDRVMRCPKRPPQADRRAWLAQAGHRVDPADVGRLALVEQRQQPRGGPARAASCRRPAGR